MNKLDKGISTAIMIKTLIQLVMIFVWIVLVKKS